MVLNGKEYSELGTVNIVNNTYNFLYDGNNVIYEMKDNNEDFNKSTAKDFEILLEKIILNKVSNELVKEYNNLDPVKRIDSMALYISLLNQNVNKIEIPKNIPYDFSTKEKAKETEEQFLISCNNIFNEINKDIKNRIDIINKTNEIKPIETLTYLNNTDDELSIYTLRSKLTDEEETLLSIYTSQGIDTYTALLMIYNERPSVIEYINEGYLLKDAIKESFKHTKVMVLEPPKKTNESAYVDIFSLLIIGEMFIYGLIMAILLFIK